MELTKMFVFSTDQGSYPVTDRLREGLNLPHGKAIPHPDIHSITCTVQTHSCAVVSDVPYDDTACNQATQKRDNAKNP